MCVCGGGGVGDRLESPVKPIQFLWCFFLHVLLLFCTVFFLGGGGKLLI